MATARTICYDPMYLDDAGGQKLIFVGLWHHDAFVRTAEGWRICVRRQEKGYLHGLPAR
jgi:hypothetical protein